MDAALDEWLASFERADPSESASMTADAERRLEELGYRQ